MFETKLVEYINAAFSAIWINTSEPIEAEKILHRLASENNWQISIWDCTISDEVMHPLAVLQMAASKGSDQITVSVAHNYHLFTDAPKVLQSIINTAHACKATRGILVVLSCVQRIPPELQKVFTIIDHDLPDADELKKIAALIKKDDGEDAEVEEKAIEAAAGLTSEEAESAFSLSTTRFGSIKSQPVWEVKEQILKKSGLLQLSKSKNRFANIGGLHGLKEFTSRALQPAKSRQTKAKGVLLLGVPGTGKSAFAQALGNETDRATLTLDFGSLMGSLVGETETNIRKALQIADAMQPCILFADEIEKGLAGASDQHSGDSGVSSRMFGTVLTWLNDHESDVFFIGTCNNVSKLPPEFSRAERFDAIFFLEFPDSKEKEEIWDLYQTQYKVKGKRPDDTNWTGAEIKSCCRLASLLDVNLQQAAQNIVPISKTAGPAINELRTWANNRCLCARNGGVYTQQTEVSGRRVVKAG